MKAKNMRRLLRKKLGYSKKEGTRGNGSHQKLVSDQGYKEILFAFHDKLTFPPHIVRRILIEQVGLSRGEQRRLPSVHDVHLIFTVDEGGFTTVTSPQIPELIGGWASPQEAAPAVDDLLQFADVPEGTHVEWHEQKYLVGPSGLEYLVRFSVESPPNAERESSVGRALAAIENGDIEDDKDRQPTTATGECIIIAVSGTDTLVWVLDQIGEDQSVTIQSNPHGEYCYSAPILGADKDIGQGKGDELEALGLRREATVLEAMDKIVSKEAATLRPTASQPSVAVHKDLTHT